jgi:hypothetical protein
MSSKPLDEKSRAIVESDLRQMWGRLNIDWPSNWTEIMDFVCEDIEETSGWSFGEGFTSEDVLTAFRRFVEAKTSEEGTLLRAARERHRR